MKRVFLCLFLALLLISAVAAKDITAITGDGRVVVLHDNGRWEYKSFVAIDKPYVGTWSFSEEFFETLIELTLLEENIYPGSSEYEFYKAFVSEMLRDEMDEILSLELELRADGSACLSAYGDEESFLYEVDPESRVLILVEGEERIPFGIFSKDYSSLNLMGMEGFSFSKIR